MNIGEELLNKSMEPCNKFSVKLTLKNGSTVTGLYVGTEIHDVEVASRILNGRLEDFTQLINPDTTGTIYIRKGDITIADILCVGVLK